MLFAALVTLTVAYSMLYAALHGNWQFWKYWLPGTTPGAKASTTAAVA